MYNRAEVIDQNFRKFVKEGRFPQARIRLSPSQAGIDQYEFIDIFESQCLSRHLDLRARKLKSQGHCYYTIGSSGHEGNAALGKVFRHSDMAFLHYRSGPFMVQRYKQRPGMTPLYDLLCSFTARKEEPIAGGRHKVFGHRDLLVPPQTSTIASHLPKAVGAALSISRAKALGVESLMPEDAVVTCSFGDASANHATALSAFNTAGWVSYQNLPMPLVFICEDNGIGISVPTPERWIEATFSRRPRIKYIKCDGLNLLDTYYQAKRAAMVARSRREPVFLHMECVRLLGHAGSDVESTYHTNAEIEATEFDDPLLHSARTILENRWMESERVVELYEACEQRIKHVSEYVCTREPLSRPEDVESSITANRYPRQLQAAPEEDLRRQVFGREYEKLKAPQHMAKLINWTLTDLLIRMPNTLVFGEDVALKGGVYHVTDGLYKRFGAKRVFNSPLDETSIIGAAVGLAHNGFVPIPEIQFLAYVHNAEDQIRGEAATLAFFSQGQFTNPMVLRIAGLAYQKGFGGHFHNDNSLAVFRDIPGLMIAVPSHGADGAKMLRYAARAAHEQGRVVIFIEPIARYMTKDLHEEGDKLWTFEYPDLDEELAPGNFGVYGGGEELGLLTYGNGTYESLRAQKVLLDKHNIQSRVIDLRWLAPLDFSRLAEICRPLKNLLVVEECRRTGSMAEALVASLVERGVCPPLAIHGAQDCFIPLGEAAAAGLPSRSSIVEAALQLMGGK